METDKNSRLLYLYDALLHGSGIRKKDAAEHFGVNERSIQRDIDCLRNFLRSMIRLRKSDTTQRRSDMSCSLLQRDS